MLLVTKIDQVARAMCEADGWVVDETTEFSRSTHPRLRRYFHLACVAYEELTGDYPDLYSQCPDKLTIIKTPAK